MSVYGSAVIVFEYTKELDENQKFKKEPTGRGCLIAFGVDSKEYDHGVMATYSTAIVRMDDNTVQNVPVENIQFI